MDINELSRKMYDNIPFGGVLFTVDKIGLQIETKNINKANIELWKKNNYITILTFGNVTQINIHAEFQPLTKCLSRKCINAITILLNAGIFQAPFVIQIMNVIKSLYPFILFFDVLTYYVINTFFKVVVWEWALDFCDHPLFSFIDTNKESNKSLKSYKNSDYSKDGKKITRFRIREGKSILLSKGRQQSLYIHYYKGKKINAKRHIERIEIRQQGKYKKDLTNDLLIGDIDDAFNKAIPMLKKQIKKVIHGNALVLHDYWKSNKPKEYSALFDN